LHVNRDKPELPIQKNNSYLSFESKELSVTTSTLTKESYELRSHFKVMDALAIASIFAIGGLVYGVFATSLGFYWDDWPVVWVYNALGPQGVARYFAGQRPAYGWIIAHVAQIIGIAPVGWHILSLLVRCTSSAMLFVAFSALWPRRRDFAWLVGTFVLLYPGFTLQPIGLGFLEYHLSFLFFVVSLTATIFSITRPAYRWLFIAVSLFTEALSYIVIEYFVGLEFLRLLIILFLTCRGDERRILTNLKSSLIASSPYVVVWTAYLVWRAFIFHVISGYGPSYMNVGSHVSEVLRNPAGELLRRSLSFIHNILMSSILAWSRPFSPSLISFIGRSQVISWIIAAIVVATSIYTLRRLTVEVRNEQSYRRLDDPENFHRAALILGILGLVVAGIPLVVPGQLITFDWYLSFDDRFTLPFMLPASIILAWLLTLLGTRKLTGAIVLSAMLSAFSVYQSQNGAIYRGVWLAQRSLFWQIAWRAPVLKQGTSLLVDGMPRPLYGNHSAGTLDMLYSPDSRGDGLNYFMFDLSRLSVDEPFWSGKKLNFTPNHPLIGRVRSFEFAGTTTQSLVAWISPTGTFRVVTQPHASEILEGSSLDMNLSQVSHPEQVISDGSLVPAGPLLKILGPEPKNQWLYFYQKAELQRQLQNWGVVAELGDEVRKEGFVPKDPSEWFPFIDAYTRTHQYRTAASISINLLNERPDALEPLTSIWLRVKQEDSQNSPELSGALVVLGDRLPLGDAH
jgi:hypothetical protein